MSRAVEGAVLLAGAATLGAFTMGIGGVALEAATQGMWAVSAIVGMAAGGVAMEAGAIAGAISRNGGVPITTRQAAAPRQIIYGQQRVGGIVIYKSTTGSHKDQLNYVIVLAGHECDSIVNLYLDGRQVHWAGGVGNVTRNGVNFGGNADSNTYTGPDGVQYNFGGSVYCEARFGDQLEGDVISGLTANDPIWAAGPNGSPWVGGCTYIYLKLESNATLFPGEPEIRVTVNGKNNIWDPRTQSYGFTSNWALCAADVLTDPVYGIGDNTVNQAQLIAAANICDEQVALAVSPGTLTEARYATNYHYDTTVAPGTVLDTMMLGAAGRLSRVNGQWFLWPAYWQGPSFSFDEGDITAEPDWKGYRSMRDRINRVNGTYIAPSYPYNIAGNLYDQNGFYNGQIQNNFPYAFQPTNFPQYAADANHGYPSDQYLAEDQGIQYPMELTLATVLSITQAQRVAKINLMRNRQQGSGSLEMSLGAFVMQPADVFQMTDASWGWSNKILEVTQSSFSVVDGDQGQPPTIRVSFNVQETDSSVYEWTAASEEETVYAQPASPSQTPLVPAPPTEMTLNSGPSVTLINPDGTVNNLIVVGWNTPLDNLAIGIQIQYQLAGASSWLSAPNADISLNSQWISNVVPGQFYNVQIRSYRANGAASSWLSQNDYEVVNTPTFLGTLSAQIPVLTQSVGVSSGEMITNGNFANGLTDWTDGYGTPVIDTTQYKLGTQSLRGQGIGVEQNINLIAGHTYLYQAWVMTDGSVVANGSYGAGIYVYDPSSQITIQKASLTPTNLDNNYPGVLISATGATPWTLVQMTFMVANSGTYTFNLTDTYGIGGGGGVAHTWFDGVSLTDTTGAADVTASQPIVTAASSESIVPNGSFQLGNMSGWIPQGFTYGVDGDGPRIYAPASGGQGAATPTFQIIPGAKYRFVYTCYNGSGSGGIYFRLVWQGKTATMPANVVAGASGTSYGDFQGGYSVTGTPTGYAYDWTAPAGAYYASMVIYNIGASDLACQKLECFPYVAVGQYGADVTVNNTSNDTNYVNGIPSSTISEVVPVGFKIFLNNGAREISFQAVT